MHFANRDDLGGAPEAGNVVSGIRKCIAPCSTGIFNRSICLKPEDKNPHALALGKLGGLKGGKARAEKLTKEQRTEIARKAANTRWINKNNF
jgi:hypothetical protein